jgi:hypothetical protein
MLAPCGDPATLALAGHDDGPAPPDPGPEPVRPVPKVFPGGLDTAGNYHPPGTKRGPGRLRPSRPPPRPVPADRARENPYGREVLAALADAKRIGVGVSVQTRYLTMFNYPEEDREKLWRKVIDLYANGTSRSGQIYKVRRVGTCSPSTCSTTARCGRSCGRSSRPSIRTSTRCSTWAGRRSPASPRGCRRPRRPSWWPLPRSRRPDPAGRLVLQPGGIQAGRKGTGTTTGSGQGPGKDFDALIQFDRKKSQDIRGRWPGSWPGPG